MIEETGAKVLTFSPFRVCRKYLSNGDYDTITVNGIVYDDNNSFYFVVSVPSVRSRMIVVPNQIVKRPESYIVDIDEDLGVVLEYSTIYSIILDDGEPVAVLLSDSAVEKPIPKPVLVEVEVEEAYLVAKSGYFCKIRELKHDDIRGTTPGRVIGKVPRRATVEDVARVLSFI